MKNYLSLLHLNDHKKYVQAILLALALVLDAFDCLRFRSLHLSLGHLILLFFMARFLIDTQKDKQIKITQRYARNQLALFWGLFWILYVVGFVHSAVNGIETPQIAAYDFKSYMFNTALSLLIASSFDEFEIDRFFALLISFSIFILASLLLIAYLTDSFFGYKFWYATTRFSPLSTSPNLIALLIVVVPFLIIDRLARENFKTNKITIFYLITLFIAICIGIKTLSDALFYAWLLVSLSKLFFHFGKKLGSVRNKNGFLFFVLILSLCAFYFATEYNLPEFSVNNFISVKLQALKHDVPERIVLLKNAIEPIKNSILFGHGPGSFSGITGSYQGYDSHNSFVEWTISTGLPGLALLIIFYQSIWVHLQKNRPYIFGAFCALSLFSLAHNVFSYSIFWVLMTCFFVLSKSHSQD